MIAKNGRLWPRKRQNGFQNADQNTMSLAVSKSNATTKSYSTHVHPEEYRCRQRNRKRLLELEGLPEQGQSKHARTNALSTLPTESINVNGSVGDGMIVLIDTSRVKSDSDPRLRPF